MNTRIELYKERVGINEFICSYHPKQRADIRMMLRNLRRAGFNARRTVTTSNSAFTRVDYYVVTQMTKYQRSKLTT